MCWVGLVLSCFLSFALGAALFSSKARRPKPPTPEKPPEEASVEEYKKWVDDLDI